MDGICVEEEWVAERIVAVSEGGREAGRQGGEGRGCGGVEMVGWRE